MLTNVLRSLVLHAGAQRNSWLALWAEILAFFYQGKKTLKESMRWGNSMWKHHFTLKRMWWITGNKIIEHMKSRKQKEIGSKVLRKALKTEMKALYVAAQTCCFQLLYICHLHNLKTLKFMLIVHKSFVQSIDVGFINYNSQVERATKNERWKQS